ncbi:MAG: carboxypeptidase-like regulatory domain-containing protein [Bacteroidota bacterium]|nr:carboxypeptidase-like regulatory domain-containing protein [Bacteroidota bacterium]
MKIKNFLFIPIFLAALLFVMPSCSKSDDPLTGTLTIIVVDSTGQPMPLQKIFLARTLQEVKDTDSIPSNWTDQEGKFKFAGLYPGYYWYRIDNWKNFGASRVYAGIDSYSIFLVDKPNPHK